MPSYGKAENTAYMREYRKRSSDRGICDTCHAAPASDGKKCTSCTARAKRYRDDVKQAALDHYGGKCVCCGETGKPFLSFDHVNNDGADMRRKVPSTNGGGGLHYWLRRNNYPADFQILCFNCNVAKHHNGGICPHQDQE